jgi:hypothetical protein
MFTCNRHGWVYNQERRCPNCFRERINLYQNYLDNSHIDSDISTHFRRSEFDTYNPTFISNYPRRMYNHRHGNNNRYNWIQRTNSNNSVDTVVLPRTTHSEQYLQRYRNNYRDIHRRYRDIHRRYRDIHRRYRDSSRRYSDIIENSRNSYLISRNNNREYLRNINTPINSYLNIDELGNITYSHNTNTSINHNRNNSEIIENPISYNSSIDTNTSNNFINTFNQSSDNLENIISKTSEFTINNNNNIINKKCSICLNTYLLDQKVRILPCMHYYHSNCIDIWFKDSSKCPICQYNLSN